MSMSNGSPLATRSASPFSNEVIAGLRELREQQFDYAKFAGDGVTMAFATANAVDAQAKSVTLADGARLPYDRLVLAPEVELDGLNASEVMERIATSVEVPR